MTLPAETTEFVVSESGWLGPKTDESRSETVALITGGEGGGISPGNLCTNSGEEMTGGISRKWQWKTAGAGDRSFACALAQKQPISDVRSII